MPTPRPSRNAFENVVFALGLLLVVALVAALVAEALRRPDGGPRLSAEAGEPDGDVVTLAVHNTGGAVAERVRVEACGADALEIDPPGADACGEVEIAYLPAGATREATVAAAGAGPVRVRILSYLTP